MQPADNWRVSYNIPRRSVSDFHHLGLSLLIKPDYHTKTQLKLFTFKKGERLCNNKLIKSLLDKGTSFLIYPFRISWLICKIEYAPAQVLISVPKKRFPKAHQRNRIKRLIRESYRLNKEKELYAFLNSKNVQLILMINYIGNDILNFSDMENKLTSCLQRIVKNIRNAEKLT